MPEEENNIKKIIIRKSLQRVRQKYIEAEKELNNLYDFLSDINVDLEVATDAENADTLEEAINCFVQYGEYNIDGILKELGL
ncbi:hypothetical protein DW044_12830 [Lachnospira eligens]|jgi:hypothetical protein|nr:hypothetical protein DW044_12830 [Lachnospira eligens]